MRVFTNSRLSPIKFDYGISRNMSKPSLNPFESSTKHIYNIEHFLIKEPKSTFKIPRNLESHVGFIKSCASLEKTSNDKFDRTYAYLSVKHVLEKDLGTYNYSKELSPFNIYLLQTGNAVKTPVPSEIVSIKSGQEYQLDKSDIILSTLIFPYFPITHVFKKDLIEAAKSDNLPFWLESKNIKRENYLTTVKAVKNGNKWTINISTDVFFHVEDKYFNKLYHHVVDDYYAHSIKLVEMVINHDLFAILKNGSRKIYGNDIITGMRYMITDNKEIWVFHFGEIKLN